MCVIPFIFSFSLYLFLAWGFAESHPTGSEQISGREGGREDKDGPSPFREPSKSAEALERERESLRGQTDCEKGKKVWVRQREEEEEAEQKERVDEDDEDDGDEASQGRKKEEQEYSRSAKRQDKQGQRLLIWV